MKKVINSKNAEIAIQAFHPGILLLEEIKERKIPKEEFASSLGISSKNLTLIFAGKERISSELALKIQKKLDISAEYWCGMQADYDLQIAKVRQQIT